MYCLGWRMKSSCYDGADGGAGASGSCPTNSLFWIAAAAVVILALSNSKGKRGR